MPNPTLPVLSVDSLALHLATMLRWFERMADVSVEVTWRLRVGEEDVGVETPWITSKGVLDGHDEGKAMLILEDFADCACEFPNPELQYALVNITVTQQMPAIKKARAEAVPEPQSERAQFASQTTDLARVAELITDHKFGPTIVIGSFRVPSDIEDLGALYPHIWVTRAKSAGVASAFSAWKADLSELQGKLLPGHVPTAMSASESDSVKKLFECWLTAACAMQIVDNNFWRFGHRIVEGAIRNWAFQTKGAGGLAVVSAAISALWTKATVDYSAVFKDLVKVDRPVIQRSSTNRSQQGRRYGNKAGGGHYQGNQNRNSRQGQGNVQGNPSQGNAQAGQPQGNASQAYRGK